MILIVGLGNPGKEYKKTRHNVGFMVVDKIAEQLGVEFKNNSKFLAETAEATMQFATKRVRVVLAKPTTFMNRSGDAVSSLIKYYKLRTEDQVFVVHDDLDIELGKIRIRLSGSSAGQKGVESIIKSLGTDKFVRVRIGVCPETGQPRAAEDYVLERFTKEESFIIEGEIDQAIEIIIEMLDKGIFGTTI